VLQNGVTGSDLGFVGRSADSSVLVDEAGHGVVAFDSERGQGDDCGVVVGGELVAALVGPVVVEMVGVGAEDLVGVATVKEQDPVGALLADRADEAFRVRVAVGAARGDFGHGDGFAGQDRVERSSELGVAIPDEEPELVGAVADLPQQLPGLLGDPGSGGMSGYPEDVHPASAHFHDEQCVEARERDRVDREEIRGQQPAGLGGEECAPLTASSVSLWCGSETGAAQHPAHGGRADPVPEPPQLTMHATESPAGILDAKPGDELAQFPHEGRASWGQRLSPPFRHQALVPSQQGEGGDDPMTPQYTA